jgi:lipopolysaccharide assembly protein A
MSALNGTRSAPVDPAATTTPPNGPDATAETSPKSRVPRTRTGATWVGICAAALTLVVLIIFMLQNTRKTEVTFLWMHGTVPLALALLIAGVGVTILALVVGTARITQLRRGSRQRH